MGAWKTLKSHSPEFKGGSEGGREALAEAPVVATGPLLTSRATRRRGAASPKRPLNAGVSVQRAGNGATRQSRDTTKPRPAFVAGGPEQWREVLRIQETRQVCNDDCVALARLQPANPDEPAAAHFAGCAPARLSMSLARDLLEPASPRRRDPLRRRKRCKGRS